MIKIQKVCMCGLGLLPLVTTFEATAQKKEKEQNKPNVIYIMADDLGIGDLGCYGQKRIKTPNIDALAANGMKFMQHYSGSTVSAPSRCCLMTGKHTGHSTVRGNGGHVAPDGRTYDMNLNDSDVTVGEIFKEAGYVTGCCGKWGMGGPDEVGCPNKQGFDYFFGYLGQLNAHRYYPTQLFENNTPIMLNKMVYSHDTIMAKAMEFIDKNSDSPFFLYLTPTIPHADIIVPDGELMGYDGKFLETPYKGGGYTAQPKPRATFAAMVSRLDKGVGEIMALLKQKGIDKNTIVIFTSDNGTHMEGGHDPAYFKSAGPYRGTKRDLYEGGIHTPFIVYWPDVIQGPVACWHTSAFWDFMPTVCELTGVKVPSDSDGISYLPSILGKDKLQKKHDYLYFEFHEEGGKQAILKDGWKLIRLQVDNPKKTRLELYNYIFDPGENANVAQQYPNKVSELEKLMDKAHQYDAKWAFGNEKQ